MFVYVGGKASGGIHGKGYFAKKYSSADHNQRGSCASTHSSFSCLTPSVLKPRRGEFSVRHMDADSVQLQTSPAPLSLSPSLLSVGKFNFKLTFN